MRIWVKLLAIAGCMLLTFAWAGAQGDDRGNDPTPFVPTLTPVLSPTPAPATSTAAPTVDVTLQGVISAAEAEVIFPVAVRFTVIVALSQEQVASAAFSITREGQPAASFPIDLTTQLSGGDTESTLAFVWMFENADLPRLFETIEYSWMLLSTSGERGQVTGRFQFTDNRVIWAVRSDPERRFDLSLPQGVNPDRLGENLDLVYDLLMRYTGLNPRLHYQIYGRDLPLIDCPRSPDGTPAQVIGPLSGTVLACSPDQARQIFDASGTTPLQIDASVSSFLQVQDGVASALFDAFYARVWGDVVVPDWLRFGLMRLVTPGSHAELLPPVLEAARSGRLLSIEDMQFRPDDDSERSLWDSQAFAMTLFVADQVGLPGLFDLSRQVASAGLDQVYENVVGQPFQSLPSAFRDWLLNGRLDVLAGFSVYAEATSIPSPTASLTPFPPTRTPRPLPSATFTATITRTPTPRPSATITPSVTPRPPGSLNTPTPVVPARSVAESSGNDPRASILAALVIVLAVLVFTFARVGRR